MGQRNRDRELRDARMAYLAATRRLHLAHQAIMATDPPLDPGRGAEPVEWTHEQVQAVIGIAKAWRDVAMTRKAWDQMRREWQPPH